MSAGVHLATFTDTDGFVVGSAPSKVMDWQIWASPSSTAQMRLAGGATPIVIPDGAPLVLARTDLAGLEFSAGASDTVYIVGLSA